MKNKKIQKDATFLFKFNLKEKWNTVEKSDVKKIIMKR